MHQTAIFRKQHAELERQAKGLEAALGTGFPGDLRRDLARFSGLLRAHLMVEDRSMYPALMADENPEIRDMAAEYQRTMGNLLAVFNAYYSEWSQTGAIEEDRPRFVRETEHVLGAMHKRILLENDNLYATIDREDLVVI